MSASKLFCPHCGASLPSDSRFCESCGKPLPTQAAPVYPPSTDGPAELAQPAPAARSVLSNKWLIAVLAGGALLALISCIALVVGLTIYRRVPSSAVSGPAPVTPEVVMPEAPTPELLQPTTVREEPAPVPPTQEPAASLPRYDYDGVSFSYDPALAGAVEPESVPAQPSGPDVAPWDVAPQHRRLSFLAYPLQDTFHQPVIYIYPLQEYYAVDPSVGDRLGTLQQMLIVKRVDILPATLPFFPTWNAGQMMYTQVKYLDFKNGSGVRYLTQFGQAAYPISNQTLFYTFQGLSSDGRWLISAVLPVANPILPDPEPLLQDPAFYDNYLTYLDETKALLSQQPDASYTPDLALLDALFASLEVK